MAVPLRSYAERNGRLNALIDSQRASGADLVYALPSVVVIGSQSVGKSSLIEGFSRVKLPRAQNTCTRVPMQVSLTYAEGGAWTGRVGIRPAAKGSTEIHFADLTKPNEVTGMLLRAQSAALAMSEDSAPSAKEDVEALLSWKELTDADLEEEMSDYRKAFSRNCVVLRIRSDETPSLTIFDLPGLIASGNEDTELVRDLAKTYLADNALILCVLSTTHDVDNQESWTLARTADPMGERTIGVLTRVDACPPFEEAKWIDMMRGTDLAHHLKHGFYAVRQVTSQELEAGGLTYREARSREETFFQQHPTWKKLDASTQKFIGTPNLVAALSDKLAEFIANQLPEMLEKANAMLRQAQNDTLRLPEPVTDDATTYVLSALRSIRQACDATVTNGRGVSDIRLKSRAFAEDLRDTKPVFDVKMPRKLFSLQPTAPTFAANTLFSGAPFGTAPNGQPISIFNGVPQQTVSETPPPQRPRRNSLVPAAVKLDDVKRRIEANIGRTLPGSVPEVVKKEMMLESTAQWSSLSKEYAYSVKPEVEEALLAIIDEHTAGFNGLRQLMRRASMSSGRRSRTSEISIEAATGHIQTFSKYKSRLIAERVGGTINSTDQARRDLGAALKQAGFEDVSIDEIYLLDKVRKSKGNASRTQRFTEDRSAIDLAASTIAYWKCCRKKVADQIPEAVDRLYVRDLPCVLDATIQRELYRVDDGQTSSQRIQALVTEDPTLVQRRKDLNLKQIHLLSLIVALEDFKRKEGVHISSKASNSSSSNAASPRPPASVVLPRTGAPVRAVGGW